MLETEIPEVAGLAPKFLSPSVSLSRPRGSYRVIDGSIALSCWPCVRMSRAGVR
jgi:hypothetical protein